MKSIESLRRTALLKFSISCLFIQCLVAQNSWACGVNSHLWITDSAICQLPMGSSLRSFYSIQRRVDLTRLGSSFPDSGYAIEHAYGEVAHWPPFIRAYIEDFQARHGSDEQAWSEEALDEVAFILGVTAHGYEDELFDTQFLRWTEQEDGAGQDILDATLDFLLIYERHTELFPPETFPSAGVTSALQRAGVDVEEAQVLQGVGRVRNFALGLTRSPDAVGALVELDRPLIPWAIAHYLDRDIEGSFAHEPRVIAALLEATFRRLKGDDLTSEFLLGLDPNEGVQLSLSRLEAEGEAKWLSLYFAVGIQVETLLQSLSIQDGQGRELEFDWRSTRWGGGQGLTRLFQFSPRLIDEGDRSFTLTLNEGIETVDGRLSELVIRRHISLCEEPNCGTEERPELRWGGQQEGCWVLQTEQTDEDAGLNDSMDFGVSDGFISEDEEPDELTDFGRESALLDQGSSEESSEESRADMAEGSSQPAEGCAQPMRRYDLTWIFWLGVLLIRRRWLQFTQVQR